MTAAHEALFAWAVAGYPESDGLPEAAEGFLRAQAAASPAEAAALVREHRLPREALRSEHLDSPEVWEALLEDAPMTAMIRNLANATRYGVLAPGSEGTRRVVAQLGDGERIRRARVHPLAVLLAMRTYAHGSSSLTGRTWNPVAEIVDALDAAFYEAFACVEGTDKRLMLALDVSGSMRGSRIAGTALSAREGAAAMALVTSAVEDRCECVAFASGEGSWLKPGGQRARYPGHREGLQPFPLGRRRRLDDVVAAMEGMPFGGTDCALPMIYATEAGREVDAFVVYTDSETWAGDIQPFQALRAYRERSGIPARLVVVGMTSNGFSIADPSDAGMLDVVGFDASAPALISEFVAGRL